MGDEQEAIHSGEGKECPERDSDHALPESSFGLARPAKQHRASRDQHWRRHNAKGAKSCTEGIGETSTQRAGQVAIDTKGSQQPQRDEGYAPHVMTVSGQYLTNGKGLVRTLRGGRGTTRACSCCRRFAG
jgi:hypothetical protein